MINVVLRRAGLLILVDASFFAFHVFVWLIMSWFGACRSRRTFTTDRLLLRLANFIAKTHVNRFGSLQELLFRELSRLGALIRNLGRKTSIICCHALFWLGSWRFFAWLAIFSGIFHDNLWVIFALWNVEFPRRWRVFKAELHFEPFSEGFARLMLFCWRYCIFFLPFLA